MTQIITSTDPRTSQGDIYRDVDFIEHVTEAEGVIEVSRIAFPLVVVLTQDCDLEHDYRFRDEGAKSQDKWLLSVLVAPLYNKEHVFTGDHLSELGYKMQSIPPKSSHADFIQKNQLPRYHFLDFPAESGIVPSVIDFKHYFSVDVSYLHTCKPSTYVCTIAPLYREEVSRRFASFLSRIGLPESLQLEA